MFKRRSRAPEPAAYVRDNLTLSFAGTVTWTPPCGGLTIWARLPGGLDSGAFAQAASRRGVAIVPGRLLSAADGARSRVRLAFTPPPERLAAAIATLAEIRP